MTTRYCPRHDGHRTTATCEDAGCTLIRRKPRPGRTGPCFYCGDTERRTRDHVIPQRLGAAYRRHWNIVNACPPCNNDKGDQQLADWLNNLPDTPKGQQTKRRIPWIVGMLLAEPQLRNHRIWIDPTNT